MHAVVASPPILVRMKGITKRFGPVPVLRQVTFEVHAGEVHVLAGENGAGKSTLIKILAGVHTGFEGELEIDGYPAQPRSPIEAAALGVAVIHQELSLVGPMSIADNLLLGRTPTRAGFVRERAQRNEARHALEALGLDLDVRRPVEDFPIAIRQLIEIAKALRAEARVIVMDEPTSALNAPEVERLFALIDRLKRRGCGIVYITHKMEEIEQIADRITVLRDGIRIDTASAADWSPSRLITAMVGRQMAEQIPRHETCPGADRLRLERFSVYPSGFSKPPTVRDIDLSVRAGEIVGIGGLQGSGASDLLLGLFGAYRRAVRGQVWVDGRPARFDGPRDAMAAGVALLTSDRKETGLVLSMSIIANATLAGLRSLSPLGWRRPDHERAAALSTTRRLGLQAASLELEVDRLSGGNQQKVALAKWLQIRPRILLLDEPTRGIDVGAKHEIYGLIHDWTTQGIAILLITSEMPELLALSDRILVLHRGAATSWFDRATGTPEAVLTAAMGREAVPTAPG
jgi:ribose transport system ATP-binding protein